MISPTIGRVVLVHREYGGTDQAEPALVCYVHHDRLINVGGFDRNGQPFSATDIVLLQDDDAAPESGNWAEWMPYQKTQAAQAESKTVEAGTPSPDPAPEPSPEPAPDTAP